MKVIKRNDSEQIFDIDKIVNAIRKANNNKSVPENERMDEVSLQKVVATVRRKWKVLTVLMLLIFMNL